MIWPMGWAMGAAVLHLVLTPNRRPAIPQDQGRAVRLGPRPWGAAPTQSNQVTYGPKAPAQCFADGAAIYDALGPH